MPNTPTQRSPRRATLVLLAVVLALLAAGCGNDSEEVAALDPTRQTSELTETEAGGHAVYTDIVIEATPEQVWEVLTDFDNMPTWSSGFQGLQGDLTDGGLADAIFLNGTETVVSPHTLIWSDGDRFGWSEESSTFPGITDNHLHIVGDTDGDRTVFIQSDDFHGTNPNITTQQLADIIQPLYETFNQELKQEVERRFG